MQRLWRTLPWIAGGFTALLAARLLAKLLAARPDNPIIQFISTLTDPLVSPLTHLDSGQPRFGAVLELSTLTLLLLIPLVTYGVWRLRRN